MENRKSSCLLRFGQKEIDSGKSANEVLGEITSLTGASGKVYLAICREGVPGLKPGKDTLLVATLRREEIPAELTEKLFEMHVETRRTAAQWNKAYSLLVPVLQSWENGGMNEHFYLEKDSKMLADHVTVKEGNVHHLEEYFQLLEFEFQKREFDKEIGA